MSNGKKTYSKKPMSGSKRSTEESLLEDVSKKMRLEEDADAAKVFSLALDQVLDDDGDDDDDDDDDEASFDLTKGETVVAKADFVRRNRLSFLPPASSTRSDSPPELRVSFDGLFQPNKVDLLASKSRDSYDGEIARAQVAQLQLVLDNEKKEHQRTHTAAEQEKTRLVLDIDQAQRSLLSEAAERVEMSALLTSEEEAHVDTKKQRDAALAQVKVLESKVETLDASVHASKEELEKLEQEHLSICQHQQRALKVAEERASVAEQQAKEALGAAAPASAEAAAAAEALDKRPDFDLRVRQHLSNRLADTLVPNVQGRRASQVSKRGMEMTQNVEEFLDAVTNESKEVKLLNELDVKIDQLFKNSTNEPGDRRSLPAAEIKSLYLEKNDAWRELAIAISHEAHARIKRIETLRDVDMQQIGYLVGLEHTGGPTMISTPPPPSLPEK